MPHSDFPVGIVSRSGPLTPIGNAVFGGRLTGTTGTGFAQYRVYGMYALVLLLKGGGRYRDRRGTDQRLSKGDILVVFPETPHQYGPEAADEWDEVFLAFHGAAFEGWRASGLLPSQPIRRWSDGEAMAHRFFDILRMPCATIAESTAIAAAIHQILADILEHSTAVEEGWLGKSRQLLSGGADAPDLPEIAATLGMSYERFRKAFKAETGESPAVFRRRQRLSQAALMLQRYDLSLELIADSLGFFDAFHLSKAFKLLHGKSPSEYRRQISESIAVD
ncbi:MAG: AraC family transcriptional regulator [Verrucomicrobia bacterium]|jgi:AraC-like DNA-binding protein|nr:MAG: AraC family transcriptional regulator [Verrucomicrobiota bacterium]